MEPSKCQIPAEEPEGERGFEVWGLENGDVVLDRRGSGGLTSTSLPPPGQAPEQWWQDPFSLSCLRARGRLVVGGWG